MNSISLASTFYIIEASPLFTIHICQSHSPRFLKICMQKDHLTIWIKWSFALVF
nr:MAG TPA: hypothetical protein [Caudoviricetes sp.]